MIWFATISLLAGVQGFLVFREQIFTPIDEIQHVDYVRTIAETARLPVYGESRVDPRLLSLYFRQYPTPLTSQQLAGDSPALLYDYEALQYPLYYLAASPVYKLLDADPRTAIYGVRLLNVALSVLVLVLVIKLIRHVFPISRAVSALIGLTLLLVPGIALRDSQVTNQVLVTLLITLLLYTLAKSQQSTDHRRPFFEGGALAIAVLAKLTAIGAAPGLLLAWFTRRISLGLAVAAGLVGFLVFFLPWLAWAIPVYGHPAPFMGRHTNIFNLAEFALPTSLHRWKEFLGGLNYYFWFPWEWRTAGWWSWLRTIAMFAGIVTGIGALGWSVRQAVLAPDSQQRLACRLALTMLAGLVAGYVVLVISLNRVWETDARELYIFLAALAILLGSLAVRLGERLSLFVFGGLVAGWLMVDIGFYVAGTCVRCYP